MPCNRLIHWLGCSILSHRPRAKVSRTRTPARSRSNNSLHLLLIAPFLKWKEAFVWDARTGQHAGFISSVEDILQRSLFGAVTCEVADWSTGGVTHGHPCPRTPNLMISNGRQAHNSITHTMHSNSPAFCSSGLQSSAKKKKEMRRNVMFVCLFDTRLIGENGSIFHNPPTTTTPLSVSQGLLLVYLTNAGPISE